MPGMLYKWHARLPKGTFFHFNPLKFLEYVDEDACFSKEDEDQPAPQRPVILSWLTLWNRPVNPAQVGMDETPAEPVMDTNFVARFTRTATILRHFFGF